MARGEPCGGTDDLTLFVTIDSDSGFGETRGSTVTDLDEYEAGSVKHDQVDFTAATAEIACDRA